MFSNETSRLGHPEKENNEKKDSEKVRKENCKTHKRKKFLTIVSVRLKITLILFTGLLYLNLVP